MWIQDDPTIKRFISYSGQLPDHLYRYRSVSTTNVDRLIDFEILDEGIYLAGLRELNDPDEFRFQLTFGNDYSQVLAYWQKAIESSCPGMSRAEIQAQAKANADELANNSFVIPEPTIDYTRDNLEQLVRVACFTTQPTNYSMWANYAKNWLADGSATDHAGICIEYICDESWRTTTLHPVEYTDEIPEVNVTYRRESDLINALYKKAREWRGEEEWRITSFIEARPPFPSNLTANSKIKLENSVQSVIFGIKTPDSIVKEFTARIQRAKPSISFKKVVRDHRTYTRRIVPL